MSEETNVVKVKKLMGKRILLEMPDIEEQPKSDIILTPELEKAKELALFKKLTHIKVFQVGDDVVGIEAGDEVYVEINTLIRARDQSVIIGNERKMLVSEREVEWVW